MPSDYSGQNLRGRSFKGQNLEGANFSKADIRGANFTNAILKSADFSGATAGLQLCWLIPVLTINSFIFLRAGTELIAINSSIHGDKIVISTVSAIFTVLYSFSSGLFLSILLITFESTKELVKSCISFFLGALISNLISDFLNIGYKPEFTFKAIIYSLFIFVFSIYFSIILVKYNKEYTGFRLMVIRIAAIGGTSFHGADLTDTNFSGTFLQNTDFRCSKLIKTRFYEAQKLDLAVVDNTILADNVVLNLLVTLNGRGKSYVGANLRGANLIGADFKEANLKDADIVEATFEGACLEWANLTLTQAVGTNFTNAQMTGACVEAWNIESTTKLDNVDCRFVYLLENPKPGTDDRERRPSSGEFKPGEFTKLFEEVLNTVDLIFRNGIDWKAFVNAFGKVQNDNEDIELSIQGIENKGDEVVVVKVAVPEGTDKEKIHSDFTQNYQLALQAVEEKYKAELQAKDKEIFIYRQQSAEMTEIVRLLASKPINVQVDNKVENKNMANSNDSSRKFENSGTLNNSGQINLGEISGTVTNTINELPPAPEPEKPGIKELLTQLQTAIENDENLSEEDKTDALEEVKILAELAQNLQDEETPKKANKAVRMLNRVFQNIPTAVSLLDLVTKISGFLGLG